MGLLDFMQDPKQAGLLMAAARMAEMSGPSRTPVGIGQILGGGMGAFMQTNQAMKQQQMQDAEQEQMQQYRGMQMQGMEQQQAAAKTALQRAQSLQQHMAKLGQGKMPAATMDGSVFTAAARRANLSDDIGTLNQIVNGVNQGLSPDEAAARVAGGAQAQQLQPQGSPYQRHMSMADHLRAGGFEAEANEYEDRALKFAPKVKNWQEVRVGDSVLMAPFFEDGTSGKPMSLEVARKLEFRDGGGTNDAFDPYTGQRKVSQRKTQSPDSIASQFTQMRGQDLTDLRARDFNAIQQDANNIQRGEKQRTVDMTRASQVASFDTMLGTLDRLSEHKGLPRSVGVMSALPTIPGSNSADFQAELETFQSQAFIPMVAQLKGMGALSDAEGRKLTAAVGALNPSMSEQAFKQSIARIKADMEQARQRVTGAMVPSPNKTRRYNPATGRIE